MDPTVAAAAIGVGGTVIVGVAGFGAAIWNTRRVLADARESRFWEKQTVAYEEALAELAKRRIRRERVTRHLTTLPLLMKLETMRPEKQTVAYGEAVADGKAVAELANLIEEVSKTSQLAALARLAIGRVRRVRVTRKLVNASKPTEVLEEYFAARNTPAWFSAEAMLLAYSSKEVLNALDKARSADRAASESLDEYQEANQHVGINPAKFDNLARVIGQTTDALRKANDSDQALINAIRAELPWPAGSNDSRPS